MKTIEDNENFNNIIEDKVDSLDKKESFVYKKPDGTIYYGPEAPPEGTSVIEDLTRISSTVSVSNTSGDVIFVDPATSVCTGRFNASVRCDFDYDNDYPDVVMENTKILTSNNVKFEDTVKKTNGLNVVSSNNITLSSAENITLSGCNDIIIGEDCKDVDVVGGNNIVFASGTKNLHWLDVPIEGDYESIQIALPDELTKLNVPIYNIY